MCDNTDKFHGLPPQTSTYEYQDLRIGLTTQGHTISEILEAVEYVLRGQGYFFDGHLDIVNEE